MMVLDSSAIYKSICLNKSHLLVKQYTCDLASFELGNIIWKNSTLVHTYTPREADELLNICEIVLDQMLLMHLDLINVFKIAHQHRITFYDASYVCLAKQLKLPLITLDHKLASKIGSVVEIQSFENFVKS